MIRRLFLVNKTKIHIYNWVNSVLRSLIILASHASYRQVVLVGRAGGSGGGQDRWLKWTGRQARWCGQARWWRWAGQVVVVGRPGGGGRQDRWWGGRPPGEWCEHDIASVSHDPSCGITRTILPNLYLDPPTLLSVRLRRFLTGEVDMLDRDKLLLSPYPILANKIPLL